MDVTIEMACSVRVRPAPQTCARPHARARRTHGRLADWVSSRPRAGARGRASTFFLVLVKIFVRLLELAGALAHERWEESRQTDGLHKAGAGGGSRTRSPPTPPPTLAHSATLASFAWSGSGRARDVAPRTDSLRRPRPGRSSRSSASSGRPPGPFSSPCRRNGDRTRVRAREAVARLPSGTLAGRARGAGRAASRT